jgi:hypothetical protein
MAAMAILCQRPCQRQHPHYGSPIEAEVGGLVQGRDDNGVLVLWRAGEGQAQ